ncbi:Sperm flagellar protein 1 [Hondaea fermentalgiana]|uniref:Sperm flagellar protein 1 n=1 Tax=Hondaea fermentalgiana TaxID=2315210 RepID=A0A2R5GTU4_9STRA|nr:Sperm flagellar protein 1 [Hondaea fermentalgiana]|eukprot:GBG34270.1 Sperm flagellar protein 1 [Hondaea fermentalgiana]
MPEPRLSDEQLQDLYTWVDQVPLSRQKRNIARDFSDGVLFAEVIQHYHPKLIDIHNYSPANSLGQKMYNWETMQTYNADALPVRVSSSDASSVGSNMLSRATRAMHKNPAAFPDASNVRPRRHDGASSRMLGSDDRNIDYDDDDDNDEIHDAGTYFRAAPNARAGAGAGDLGALLEERDQTIAELQDTVSILELKVKKMEELIKLKDRKISALQQQIM